MTVVAGIVDKNRVWLGCDSASVLGWTIHRRADPKLFTIQAGIYTMGVAIAGSWAFGQLLRYGITVPPSFGTGPIDAERWMTWTFSRMIREAVDEAMGEQNQTERWKGIKDGSALVAFAGRLWIVYAADGQVGEPLEGYAALGAGGDFALGAFVGTELAIMGRAVTPEFRLQIALGAAERHSMGVEGPMAVRCFGRTREDAIPSGPF